MEKTHDMPSNSCQMQQNLLPYAQTAHTFLEDKAKKASALTGFNTADIAMKIDLQEEETERVDCCFKN
eukprot:15345941-Ditylum_brightwellii.AAC.1